VQHFLNEAVRAAIAFASDVASIASLGLTLLVYFNVRKLRRAYLFTARVPELTEELSGKASEISRLHRTSAESKSQIQVLMAESDVLLRSLKSKVSGNSRMAVRAVLLAIAEYQMNDSAEIVWRVYVAMQKCLAELRQTQLDLKWDRQL
jgi:hypothetical protein